MLRTTLLPALALALSACEPPVCGHVSIFGVDPNPDIERFRASDGSIGLLELCGTEFGSFAQGRTDTGITTLILDPDIQGAAFDAEASPIPRVVLPVASLVFWSAHLVPGTTLTLGQLAGSGLHKRSQEQVYDVWPLTSATLEVLEGPLNRREEQVIDTVDWSDEWRLRWTIEFGGGQQRWQGEDLIKRSRGTEVGSEAFTPPDPKP